MLALTSEDCTITISNVEGDTINQKKLSEEVNEIRWGTLKQNDSSKDTTVTAKCGQWIWMFDYADESNLTPLDLSFQEYYRSICSYRWFGDGYLMVGFYTGNVVIISSHVDEIGREVNMVKFHNDTLKAVTYNEHIKKGASIGDNTIQVFDMHDIGLFGEQGHEKIELEDEYGSLSRLEWTPDGQILTVSSNNGTVYNFLTSIPVIHDNYDTKVLYLTSLSQVCIKDLQDEKVVARFSIDVEPSFMALGPQHAAVGLNNRIWYYRLKYKNGTADLMGEKEYLGTIKDVQLNRQYAAVLSGGRVVLSLLQKNKDREDKSEKFFPDDAESEEVSSMALTSDFLIYSTTRGTIYFFGIEDWQMVNIYRYEMGIVSVFPNSMGTRVIFVDETHAAYLYNPVNDAITSIKPFSGSAEKVMWDVSDPNCFITSDKNKFNTYVYSPNTARGPEVIAVKQVDSNQLLSTTDRPDGFTPIFMMNGRVICQMTSGSIAQVTLISHEALSKDNRQSSVQSRSKNIYNRFSQLVRLNRFNEAWNAALELNNESCLRELASTALHNLDIESAVRVYRYLGEANYVMNLEPLLHVDEINIIIGTIAVMNKSFSEAESRFLQSSQKIRALEMRRDLMDWKRALELAEQLDTRQIPIVSREFAQQRELHGEYEEAHALYMKAMDESYLNGKPFPARHIALCKEGTARVTIRLGNLNEGLRMALDSKSPKLCRECAQVFEELRQYQYAAQLYVKAGMYEKGATLYIKVKKFNAVEAILNKLENPQLFIAYAKAKESERKYIEAERAYERANDVLNVVRINLDRLKKPSKAIEIVKREQSVEGALLIANYCKDTKNFRLAIEFLAFANQFDEAFNLALKEDEMETYAIVVTDKKQVKEYARIAGYYEQKGDYGQAGDYFGKCKQYKKALNLYIKCGEAKIDEAIELVGIAKEDELTHHLVDYLMGDLDNVPKNAKFIFRLYMALENYSAAIRTALIIATQEQQNGNYKPAHDILFDTIRVLQSKSIHVPADLANSLMLVHSYTVIRDLGLLEEPELTARLIMRVAKNISKFPNHAVPILRTTIIMCYKAGLGKQALEYANMILQPEYRSKIDNKLKQFIRGIYRKNPDGAGEDEKLSPCPYCNYQLARTELECPSCKNELPYCIVTGEHMTRDDWCMCPSCKFPAKYTKFSKLLKRNENKCPMCRETVKPSTVAKLNDVSLILDSFEHRVQKKPQLNN
eukprot:CAMPEP_0117428804 /NCGR_PEP_ID=MMETSP0758-20121206/8434_1 /TAXON_ID=63605 /ORGANISM="Percolomonas cosmopolitus, Strain AE-1 (ATCC 50343)" /LENGTH=1219 /DNA_ID=CAMNT_0005215371 /DNA_START=468 /DNA_END=4125 /DNA_ORIENTATION=-